MFTLLFVCALLVRTAAGDAQEDQFRTTVFETLHAPQGSLSIDAPMAHFYANSVASLAAAKYMQARRDGVQHDKAATDALLYTLGRVVNAKSDVEE